MTKTTRRRFLQQFLGATAGSAAFGSAFGKLQLAMGSAPKFLRGSTQDYRAMVCIDLAGGNDSFNTVVPMDAGVHATYAATRGNLTVPRSSILSLAGQDYGLHPQLSGLQSMFNGGQAAIVANVGPLVRPVNKALYEQPGTPLPPQLYSHSDQSVLWQTPRADVTTRRGWGGRLADLFAASNENDVLSMNVSLDGENVFQAGDFVSPYFMSPFGVEEIDAVDTGGPDCAGDRGWNRRRCESFLAIRDLAHEHPFERAYAGLVRNTMATSAEVKAAIDVYPSTDPVFRPFWERAGIAWDPEDDGALPWLSRQLLMIARVIRARTDLRMSRQLFFARLGGFDTHDAQAQDHPVLLGELDAAISAFYDVLDAPEFLLGSSVTTFTVSEFGRTLTNNGDGTDHGWGGHHFVFGGSVNGGQIYGRMPSLAAPQFNPDDAGWGQIIPSLSVDQYAATLASWFGLSPQDRDAIFPNLGFMNGPLLSIEGPDLGFISPV